MFGSKVRKLSSNGLAGANDVVWDGTNDLGEKVSKGAYICVIKAAGQVKTLKIGVIH